MKKIILLLFASTLALSISAEPITVSKSVTLDTKMEKIWRWTGGFCTIRVWHPAVEKCEVSKEGNSEFRTLTLGNGGKVKEKHTGGTAYGYSYIITESPFPIKDYSSTFQAEQVGDSVKFTWSSTFSAKGATDAEAKKVMTGVVESGLESIKKRYTKKNRKDRDKK